MFYGHLLLKFLLHDRSICVKIHLVVVLKLQLCQQSIFVDCEGMQIRQACILLCHNVLCNIVLPTGVKPCSWLWFWLAWWCPPSAFLCPTGSETQLPPAVCTFPHFHTTGSSPSAKLTQTALPKLCPVLPNGNSVLKMTEPSSGALICCVSKFNTGSPQACSENTLSAARSKQVKDSCCNIAYGLCKKKKKKK